MIRRTRQLKKARRAVRLSVIRRLDVQPGDVLVIRMQGQPEPGAMNRMVELLGCKAVVLPVDAKLDVVRVGEAPTVFAELKGEHSDEDLAKFKDYWNKMLSGKGVVWKPEGPATQDGREVGK